MTHLFRPADPPVNPTPPVGPSVAGRLGRIGVQLLARAGRLLRSRQGRTVAAYLALLLGLLLQGVLLLTTAYLVDLSVSLMELWADLARKHLEITL